MATITITRQRNARRRRPVEGAYSPTLLHGGELPHIGESNGTEEMALLAAFRRLAKAWSTLLKTQGQA